MSEEPQTTPAEPPKLTEDEISARLTELEEVNRRLAETNDRLLKESKGHADKWRSFRDAASADETTKLEEEPDLEYPGVVRRNPAPGPGIGRVVISLRHRVSNRPTRAMKNRPLRRP